MNGGPRLDEDYHVHSTFSDDAVSTLAENVAAARDRGLRTICLAEHVRRGTAWVPDFLSAVHALRPARTVRAFAAAGVRLVASTDSHHRRDIGVYASVRRTRDDAFAEVVL
jgi:histidinol phosphatase-like PHP family hydrolase